jgi:hypothetical protein
MDWLAMVTVGVMLILVLVRGELVKHRMVALQEEALASARVQLAVLRRLVALRTELTMATARLGGPGTEASAARFRKEFEVLARESARELRSYEVAREAARPERVSATVDERIRHPLRDIANDMAADIVDPDLLATRAEVLRYLRDVVMPVFDESPATGPEGGA